MEITTVLEKYPLQLDRETLNRTLNDIERRSCLYRNIVKDFERRYGCDLEAFEGGK